MSYEYKTLIEQAIIDDDRPLDWEEGFKELDEIYAKADAFDRYIENQQKKLRTIEHKIKFNNKIEAKDFTEYIDTRDKIDELERCF